MRACANEDHRIDILTDGFCRECENQRRAEREASTTWVNVVTGETFYGTENDMEARYS